MSRGNKGTDWELLRNFTKARIGMGRTGHAVPTHEHLKFQFDHARARDAIHWPWEFERFQNVLKRSGIPFILLKSAVQDRTEYLKRPDLGRTLHSSSRALLSKKYRKSSAPFDVSMIISNGLSSSAVNHHGTQFLSKLWRQLKTTGYRISPVFLVENARVALADEIGRLVRARVSVMILGERPGLTSFDSLAMYLTYAPRLGNTDAKRNCVSNIRPPDGLSYEISVEKTAFLLREALRRELSGVDLKDEAGLLT